ncbi:CHAD domain-containing protein, partial [Streptomyces sp. SID10244]|nr:CHAD domain-containing protein [Streptomyces sp. SID10244]
GSEEWAEQLHTIRKRAKRLRYSTDAAAPLDKKRYRKVATIAKRVQSALGDYNDSRINRARVAEIAGSGKLSGPDMFVLGRIDARQQADGQRAIDAYRKAAKDL